MEVYVLDSLFRRSAVVDRFESLIWTDRFRDIGDFELHVQSTPGNRRLFVTNTRLAITESKSVMTVETVEDYTDNEGRKKLKVKGRSLEMILEDRAAIGTYADGKPMAVWGMEGPPKWCAEFMFEQICMAGSLSQADIIPFIIPDQSAYPVDNIPEPMFNLLHLQEPESLYAAIKNLCDIYDMGFRLYRNGDTSQLFFNIYTGSDRTTRQTILPPVIFSPDLSSLLNTTALTTVEKTKNCAYVVATREVNNVETVYRELVYADNVDPNIEGFERRAMVVEYSPTQEDVTDTDVRNSMRRAGLDELAKNQPFMAFDGEISQRSEWKFGYHYFLGDLVSMQNNDDFVNHMRVMEQTFVSDSQGDRAYPTLSVNTFIQPGTWESWGFQAWEDVEATEFWSNQP